MTISQFVDISVFNPTDIDWQTYKNWSKQGDGIARVAIRSSYGTGFTDAVFETHRANALNAGIDQILYYHYAYPQFNTPEDEANWQHQVVGHTQPWDVLILDYEEQVPEATAEWAYRWLAQQEHNYFKVPGIYASYSYILERLQDSRLADFSLWLAYWLYSPEERPPCPPPWKEYRFLQYSDRASVPGIPGTVDADIFLKGSIMPGPTFNQMVVDLWNSTAAYFRAQGKGVPPRDTSIFNNWRQHLISGDFKGIPLSWEYTITRPDGRGTTAAQNFAGGTCLWNDGNPTWL